MKIGTKSLLFGYHQFIIHPLMVAWAWTKLYGFPTDIRTWFAFFLHDIGYFGKPNMDGTEGKTHPMLGGVLMYRLFGPVWGQITVGHSRSYGYGSSVSPLCYADKLAGCLYPNWLAIGLCSLSGELKEYMTRFNRKTKLEWANQYRVETLAWLRSEGIL